MVILGEYLKMGSSFNKAIFDDGIQDGLVSWAQKARNNKGMKKTSNASVSNIQDSPPAHTDHTVTVEMTEIQVEDPQVGIKPSTNTN